MINSIYNHSPIIIQNLFCTLYGYKIKNLRYSKNFNDYLTLFKQSQWLSSDEIRKYQNLHFKKIIDIAFNRVPYYKEKYSRFGIEKRDIQSLEDINKLPILTKEDILNDFNNFINPLIPKSNLVIMHTSGSTGKALSFYRTKDSIKQQWALNWRFRERFGIKIDDISCNFTGKLIVPINQTSPPFWRYNAAMKQFLVNMQHIKERNTTYFVDFLNSHNITYFSGYPSIIYQFANILINKNKKIINKPRIIFTGAEKLYDYQKELIEDVFDCSVTELYGTTEGVGNASKCEKGNFHEDFEFGYFELNNESILSNDESSCEILVTGFSNFAFPLIRFKIGDSAIWSNKKCACGRKSRVIKSIVGRNEDYVLTPEGTKIQRFDYLFKNQFNIKECQIVQENHGEIIYRIVKRANYTNKDTNKLISSTKKWISPTIKIKFEYPSFIKRTKTGKFRAIISKINNSNT